MIQSKSNKGGRKIDHNPFFFIVSAHQDPEWYIVSSKFGHMGIVLLIAINQHMCRAKHFLLKIDSRFYSTLGRDFNITKPECEEVLKYLMEETELYDKFLYDRGYLFSVDFLRGFHRAKYFRDRKYSAKDILEAINKYRPDQPPLRLEDDLEQLMNLDENYNNDNDEDFPE